MFSDRRTFWGTLAVLAILATSYVQQARHNATGADALRGAGGDFHPYYVAGKIAGHGPLYYGSNQANPVAGFVDPNTPWGRVARDSGLAGTSALIYPPLFALLMKPFTLLPVSTAFVVWRELNTLCIIAAIFLALMHFRVTPRLPAFALAVAAGVASFPVQEAMFLGQVGGVVLLLWTGGAIAAGRQRPILSAFCFALGTMIKVTPAIVIPLFIVRRQWKWLIAYTAWMLLFLGLGIWQLGWQNHVAYATTILSAMSAGFPNSRNKSLFTIIQSLYFRDAFYQLDTATLVVPPALTLVTKVICLALLAGVILYFYARNRSAERITEELATLAALSLLIAPVTWRHHYVLMILPLMALWFGRDVISDRRGLLLFGATCAVATIAPAYLLELVHNPILQIAVSAIMPAGAIALVALSVVRPKQKGEAPAGTSPSPKLTPSLNDAGSFAPSS